MLQGCWTAAGRGAGQRVISFTAAHTDFLVKRAWRSVLFKRSDLNGFLIYTFDGEGDAVHNIQARFSDPQGLHLWTVISPCQKA
jgi:hypothetical protein